MRALGKSCLIALLLPAIFAPFGAFAIRSSNGLSLAETWMYFRPFMPLKEHLQAATLIEDLESYVPSFMAKEKMAGAAIAVIHRDSVVWQKGYGLADTQRGRAMTSGTPFSGGSLAKTATAFGIIRLAQHGVLDLDKDVNAYLKRIKIQNPYGPGYPVTLRGILAHTAGLSANDGRLVGPSLVALLEPEHLRLTYPPGLYAPRVSKILDRPTGAYTWLGAQIAAIVAEDVVGKPFEEIQQEVVFRPLGMTQTSHRLSAANRALLARGQWDSSGEPTPLPPANDGDGYQAGTSLFTTISDFSKLLVPLVNDGAAADGKPFFSRRSLDEILRPHGRAGAVVELGLGVVVQCKIKFRRFAPHGELNVAMFNGLSNVASHFLCYPRDGWCALALATQRKVTAPWMLAARGLERP